MAYSPYDWNEAVRHRSEYVQNRLRDGSPVVGISALEGVLLVTVHRTQRKVFEIYDRLMYSAIGNQADIETVRNTAIDFAHREGYTRSPDDVSIQRLVGFAISPILKRAFGEAFSGLFVIRALFAEMGKSPEQDEFFALNYDGEFIKSRRVAVVAGTEYAEEQAAKVLEEGYDEPKSWDVAADLALRAWAVGRLHGRTRAASGDEPRDTEAAARKLLAEEIAQGTVEVGMLERATRRESKFRLLKIEELSPVLEPYRD